MYIENIVIGKPIDSSAKIFANSEDDWENNEKEKTLFTTERSLARILVEIGAYPSTSEIKRNRPDLMITFDTPQFTSIKISKKRRVWVLVGETD